MTNHRGCAEDVLLTTSAQTCLPLARDAVWQVVESFSTQLCARRVVVAQRPGLLVHAVSSGATDDPDGWLTWALDELTPDDTRVTVTLSEQRDGAPEPDLDLLLCQLTRSSRNEPNNPSLNPERN